MVDIDPVILANLEREIQNKGVESAAKRIYQDHFGIFNRAYFYEIMKKNSKAILRGDFSIMITDADKFKSINDTYGHGAGDLAIKEMFSRGNAEISRIKKNSLDLVCARIGGDEGLLAGFDHSESGEIMLSYFEKILLEMSSFVLDPGLSLEDTRDGSISNKKTPVLVSGGYVNAEEYLYLVRETFMNQRFIEGINLLLNDSSVESSDQSSEGLIMPAERRFYKPAVSEFDSFDFKDIGIETHQGRSLVDYLRTQEIEKLTFNVLTDHEVANFMALYVVAMQSEADHRLYEAKKAGGGLCYATGKIKGIRNNNLVELSSEEINRANARYDQDKEGGIR